MEETNELLDDLRWLRALARRLVHDPHLAEDAVQDTMVKALTRRPRTVRGSGSLRAWLGSVLHNEVRQEQRSRARRVERESRLERSDATRPTLEIVAELALHRRLVELVHELSEPQRTTIGLRFLRGKTPRQIARALDVPVKTVHSRIERGLAQLRGRLDRQFDGDRGAWVAVFAPLADRGWLGLGLGSFGSSFSMVLPMNLKLIAAGLGVVALGALAYFPLQSGAKSLETNAAVPPSAAPSASGWTHEDDGEAEAITTSLDLRRAEPIAAPSHSGELDATPPTFVGQAREMDGRAVAGLDIVFEVERQDTFTRAAGLPAIRTANDGSFTFQLPDESGRLTVESDVYACVSRPYLEGQLPGEPPTVVVAPRRVYAGRVVDEAGQPIENARVEVSLDGSWIQSYSVGESPLHLLLPFAEQRTDAFGEFHFDGLGFVEGAHVEALRDGYASARIALPEESELGLEVVLTLADLAVPAIYGHVVDANGTGVADAHVSLGWISVRSGPDGRFALELEEWQESGHLRAVKRGHMPAAVFFDRDSMGDGADAAHPLMLYLGEKPLAIRGRVVDADGEPVANVLVFTPDTTHFGRLLIESEQDSILGQVTVEEVLAGTSGPNGGWRRLETATDGSGRFELNGLLARDYTLFAMRPDLSAAGPVTVAAGAQDAQLRLEGGERRSVVGRVVSLSGLPLPGIRVALGRSLGWERPPERMQDSWSTSPVLPPDASGVFDQDATVTDADGRFQFTAVAVVDGAFINLRGPAILLGGHHRFAAHDDLADLQIEVVARCEFRVVLQNRGEADAVSQLDENGKLYPLFVQVEGKTISMADIDIVNGRSGVAQIGEGRRTLVLHKDGQEVRRVEVTFFPGTVQEVSL